jgi:hypothetical protein
MERSGSSTAGHDSRQAQHISASRDPASQLELVTLSNPHVCVAVVPAIGGRIISVVPSVTGDELLWRNQRLSLFPSEPGAAYDPVFYGGIDELLPCDLPETIDGIDCPDHGELWTTPLQWESEERGLRLWGRLPLSGLHYERIMSLSAERPEIMSQYRITNTAPSERHFLWKLHAALNTRPGDQVVCPAETAQAADLAYSTCPSLLPFHWPLCEGIDKSVVPEENGTCEFLYLSGLASGRMGLWRSSALSADKSVSQPGFSVQYAFDPGVFPFPWLFQSFGGFDGHVVTVLEPCTNMPISVADAQRAGTCTALAPGETLATTVRLSIIVPTEGK